MQQEKTYQYFSFSRPNEDTFWFWRDKRKHILVLAFRRDKRKLILIPALLVKARNVSHSKPIAERRNAVRGNEIDTNI